MHKLFAHSNDTHINAKESALHLFETWYSAIPLFLIITSSLILLVYFLSKKSLPKTFIFSAAWLLTAGISTYEISPVISTISIVAGLLASSLFALMGLVKK